MKRESRIEYNRFLSSDWKTAFIEWSIIHNDYMLSVNIDLSYEDEICEEEYGSYYWKDINDPDAIAKETDIYIVLNEALEEETSIVEILKSNINGLRYDHRRDLYYITIKNNLSITKAEQIIKSLAEKFAKLI